MFPLFIASAMCCLVSLTTRVTATVEVDGLSVSPANVTVAMVTNNESIVSNLTKLRSAPTVHWAYEKDDGECALKPHCDTFVPMCFQEKHTSWLSSESFPLRNAYFRAHVDGPLTDCSTVFSQTPNWPPPTGRKSIPPARVTASRRYRSTRVPSCGIRRWSPWPWSITTMNPPVTFGTVILRLLVFFAGYEHKYLLKCKPLRSRSMQNLKEFLPFSFCTEKHAIFFSAFFQVRHQQWSCRCIKTDSAHTDTRSNDIVKGEA